ncbi:MAG: PAS domain S-box protein [Phycisphaerales bacterium]
MHSYGGRSVALSDLPHAGRAAATPPKDASNQFISSLIVDSDLRIRSFTAGAREALRIIDLDAGTPVTQLATPFIESSLIPEIHSVLRTGVPLRRRIRISDSNALYELQILPFESGTPERTTVAILFQDVTQRVALEEPVARLAAIVESSDDAIVSKDLDGVIMTWNAGAERIFGYSAAEAIGRHISLIIPKDRLQEEAAIIRQLRAGQRVDHFETVRIRKSGSPIHVSLSISPIHDQSGAIIGASKIARDISQHKAAEEHQRILLAELDHRVKNMLAVVVSLATQTIASSTTLEDFGPAFEGRIQALSRAHRLLSDARWKGSTIDALVNQVVLPFCRDRSQCSSGTAGALLPARVALSLALVLHELATNAAKYGALSTASGKVSISWTTELLGTSRVLRCEWAESAGPAVSPPTRAGFGTTLIQRCIEYEFRGKVRLDYQPGGLRCSLEMFWPIESGENLS